MSAPLAPRKMPVTPPIRNDAMNESAQSIGVVSVIEPPYSVAMYTNIISAMGTEMSSVVTVKMLAMRGSMPAMNWWCAQTVNDSTPVANAVPSTVLYANIFLRENTVMISAVIPSAGSSTTYTSG